MNPELEHQEMKEASKFIETKKINLLIDRSPKLISL